MKQVKGKLAWFNIRTTRSYNLRLAALPQAPMKQIFIPILVCAALFCGCASPNDRAAGSVAPGTLTIRLTTLLGMQGSERDARIYVDGRFVGNYEPDETALALQAGRHVVIVEVPRVYSRRSLPNGSTEIRTYALKGEERIEVLGAGSKQSLVFNDENLKSKEIKDEDDH
jgi:hypothetical protein